ncbi:substrate-binding domain-containing protein [Rubrivivax sp. A210]|uniref:substrate-binding domain-containing protein n=1 Tax=Rubrivivax sp. A210 TaxID=2772301 RepID=UPI001917F667|nr:substrate-binding domain-containing protein [Rubrivivax sp. A210]
MISRWAAPGLAWLLALATCVVPARAEEIRIGGTGAALGTMRLLGAAYAKQHAGDVVTVLPSLGSGGGIKALAAGAVQIAVSGRPLTAAEAAAGASAVEYGRTPVVFATHSRNPVSSLSLKELAEIYSGERLAWPDGSRIRLVLRPMGDADSEAIKNLSPALRRAKELAEQRQGLLVTVTDQETAEQLEKVAGAVGPTTLALLLSERRALKPLALDGVRPDAQAIADERYPLQRVLYLVTAPRSGPAAQGFVDFARSPAGRAILQRTGHWVK